MFGLQDPGSANEEKTVMSTATGGRHGAERVDTHFQNAVDIHQYRCIFHSTTKMLYNQNVMEMGTTPEFYTGAPVDPVDLRFRGAFLAELWRTLRIGHVVLTSSRRMSIPSSTR